jgi:hypothetical protein
MSYPGFLMRLSDLLPEIGTKLNMVSYGGKGKKDAEEQAQ